MSTHTGFVLPEEGQLAQEFNDNTVSQEFNDNTVSQEPILGAPTNFDWRSSPNVLTRVKDQGNCGSCWGNLTNSFLTNTYLLFHFNFFIHCLFIAFAVNAVLEAAYNRRMGKAAALLSEQHLVDCSLENGGCNGGYPTLGKTIQQSLFFSSRKQ